jgi:large subunit ribosomal protein L29
MKTKELKKMSAKELDSKLIELKLELIKLNAQVATGTQLKSPGKIRQLKRTVARINTIKEEVEKE